MIQDINRAFYEKENAKKKSAAELEKERLELMAKNWAETLDKYRSVPKRPCLLIGSMIWTVAVQLSDSDYVSLAGGEQVGRLTTAECLILEHSSQLPHMGSQEVRVSSLALANAQARVTYKI